jgi:hypothetical protein
VAEGGLSHGVKDAFQAQASPKPACQNQNLRFQAYGYIPTLQTTEGHVRDPIYCVSRRTSLLINIVILHPVDAI